jgi:hypothetical protein
MIFVSYSWANADRVRTITHELSGLGLVLWVDFRSVDQTLPIFAQIKRGIEQSTAVLFFETPQAQTSHWVKLERSLTREFRKPVMRLRPEAGDPRIVAAWMNEISDATFSNARNQWL